MAAEYKLNLFSIDGLNELESFREFGKCDTRNWFNLAENYMREEWSVFSRNMTQLACQLQAAELRRQ